MILCIGNREKERQRLYISRERKNESDWNTHTREKQATFLKRRVERKTIGVTKNNCVFRIYVERERERACCYGIWSLCVCESRKTFSFYYFFIHIFCSCSSFRLLFCFCTRENRGVLLFSFSLSLNCSDKVPIFWHYTMVETMLHTSTTIAIYML